ncbi:MAG: hypothetical protein GC154_13570 [bacterium]|nr:hypothetical protein [bacterium]
MNETMTDETRRVSRRGWLRAVGAAAGVCLLGGCDVKLPNTEILNPRDTFLNPPTMLDPRREFGYLGTISVQVPAVSDIFLAGALDGETLESPDGHSVDEAPANSPVEVLDGMIRGGETLDIFASGTARHIPTKSISFGPRGWETVVQAGPARGYEAFQGPIGALVGLFNNQRTPFIIGQRIQVVVPRYARSLYLALLDFPGASANNEGSFDVSIEVIRR